MKLYHLFRRPLASLIALCAAIILSKALAADGSKWDWLMQAYSVRHPPYERLVTLTEGDVTDLEKLLYVAELQESRYHIVYALGFIGNDEGVEALIKFFESGVEGPIVGQDPYTLVSVVRSLGYAASKGNQRALGYLLSHSDLESWRGKEVTWTHYDGRRAMEVFATAYYNATMLALGISARPEAISRLQAIRADKRLHPESHAMAESGLELAGRVKKEGLRAIIKK